MQNQAKQYVSEGFVRLNDKNLKHRRDYVFFVIKYFTVEVNGNETIYLFKPRQDSPFTNEYRVAYHVRTIVEEAAINAYQLMKAEKKKLEDSGKLFTDLKRNSAPKSEKQIGGTIKKVI